MRRWTMIFGIVLGAVSVFTLEGFPDLAHDDEVDACSGALEMLNPHMKSWP
jgi:phage terminase large subunit-like protein